jgi:nucleotide-binding universal stress UspA family protein
LLLIKRILVAVDGSNQSLNASDFAIDMAKRFEAELIALYVIEPRYSEFETAVSPRPGRLKDVFSKAMEKGEQMLHEVKQDALKNHLIIQTDVINGITSVVKAIVDYSEDKEVNMIVVGSRGMTGFKKMLLGSVASGVVTYAHCPVVVIK